MKLPKTFCSKKNLEDKTKQLIKLAKVHNEPNLSSMDKIVDMAKHVALSNGLAKYPFSTMTCIQCYSFKEDRLRINYLISFEKLAKRENNSNITITYKGEIVLEYSSGEFSNLISSKSHNDKHIDIYIIGDWENVLADIYNNV